jgi:hypothetical protein
VRRHEKSLKQLNRFMKNVRRRERRERREDCSLAWCGTCFAGGGFRLSMNCGV